MEETGKGKGKRKVEGHKHKEENHAPHTKMNRNEFPIGIILNDRKPIHDAISNTSGNFNEWMEEKRGRTSRVCNRIIM